MTKFETEITSHRGWFDINLRELYRYRDLIFMFVKRDFIANYKQTILGPAWAIVQPLLTTIVFTIVFGNLAKLSTDGIPPFLFYMCGNVAWTYFATCLTATSITFVKYGNIMSKVYFPRLTLPISSVISALIAFSIQFVFLICFLGYFSYENGTIYLTWQIINLPLILLNMAMLGLGCGIIISALTTKYRDLAMLVNFGIQLWMYATPVVYTISTIPEKWRTLYLCNPMSIIIESFRNMFFGNSSNLTAMNITICWTVTLFIVATGILLYNRVEKTFMDTI